MYNQHYRGSCAGYARKYGRSWGRHFRSMPVNIEEKDDSFQILVFAPGLNKENFKISAKNDILTISYYNPDEVADEKSKRNFTRREYHKNSFERSFILNGKVDVEKVSAVYSEGILTVSLPKDPEKNKPAKDISVK